MDSRITVTVHTKDLVPMSSTCRDMPYANLCPPPPLIQTGKLAFGDESPYRVTVFGWFEEFFRGHNSLQDEERTGMPRWQ
ncbi:uncharacterized protein TNCV_3757321 [Trichonephila clavipes]|nr:uncharacterized protein TNCV_3757321 [Trichonephila clavipes]